MRERNEASNLDNDDYDMEPMMWKLALSNIIVLHTSRINIEQK